ncbi:MAG: proton-conducting transporter membrane subunit [Candidatus Omnitrophota bacterium]|nr:proton-conducting transporter membrane subunit [Candidatus Omnitrophota bacterium]
MYLIIFLIVFPVFIAIVLLSVKNDRIKSCIIQAAALLISLGAVMLFVLSYHHDIQYYTIRTSIPDKAMFVFELLLAAYMFYLGLRFKKYRVSILISAQALIMIFLRSSVLKRASLIDSLFIDKLTIIMSLIIGLVGSLIAVYSIAYMRDYHALYKGLKDNRRFYFFVIFIFLSAMFGLVLSNSLLWIYFFWEITTLSSFFLIGYSNINAREARRNAFRALEVNLLGGLAFALAIFYFYSRAGTIEMDDLFTMKKAAMMLPVALICFAGLIKSAQLPFSSWLLGAMAAPTPVSALLHSSTMVKAGVYIILRFVLMLQSSQLGFFISLIGGFTFLTASFIAIPQSDSKKVLAYSTIANLGLIALCAGIGTCEAVWAAALLIIFHAITKSLLFLCVGVIQDKLNSRDIEDMSGLIVTMPKISIMVQVGIAGMFLAPFGMLISKWAVLRVMVDYNPVFSIFIVFGSAAMIFFWVKWLGMLIVVKGEPQNMEKGIGSVIWGPLFILTALTIASVAFLPVISKVLIEPIILEIYGQTVDISHSNIIIMFTMMGLIMLFPLAFLGHGRWVKVVGPYLGGANAGEGGAFYASLGQVKNMEMKSYYPEKYFSETVLFRIGAAIALVLILAMFAVAAL